MGEFANTRQALSKGAVSGDGVEVREGGGGDGGGKGSSAVPVPRLFDYKRFDQLLVDSSGEK